MSRMSLILTALGVLLPALVWAGSNWVELETKVAYNESDITNLGTRQELVEAHIQQQLTDIRDSLKRLETKIDRIRTD